MAEEINGYLVSSSNSSKKTGQRGSITVKRPDGAICARVFSDHSQPLRRARLYLQAPERLQLTEQMLQCGVPQEHIDNILAIRKA